MYTLLSTLGVFKKKKEVIYKLSVSLCFPEETIRLGIHNSVFTSSMISTPKTEVPLCWEQHCKLLPGVTSIRGNDVNRWTIDQVADFINTLPGCDEQSKVFKDEVRKM